MTTTQPAGKPAPQPVRIELLSVPGCPNVDTARHVVQECLTELGLDITVIERVGRYGSPTVLVNGVDVMRPVGDDRQPATVDSAACRLDRPERDLVLAAINAALGHDGRPLTIDSLHDPVDATAARAAALPPRVRELHRRILLAFLATGQPPGTAELRTTAADIGIDLGDGLRCLAERDLVHSGQDERIRVAYPFSGEPRGHRVRLLDGPSIDAMCAIDALGIPLMTGRDAVITSSDPATGHVIRVTRHAQRWWWEPASTVVLLAQTTGCGPAGDCLCPSILFHVDRDHAERYLAEHPELTGSVVDQAEAVAVADACFGSLLAA